VLGYDWSAFQLWCFFPWSHLSGQIADQFSFFSWKLLFFFVGPFGVLEMDSFLGATKIFRLPEGLLQGTISAKAQD